MRSKARLNLLVDSVVGFVFLLSVFSGISHYVHIAVGIALTVAVMIHLGLHWTWVLNFSRKLFKISASDCRRVKVNYAVDMFIGTAFVISMLSGLGLLASDATVLNRTHELSSALFILGTMIHIVLHWRWIVAMLGSLPAEFNRSSGELRPLPTLQQECIRFAVGCERTPGGSETHKLDNSEGEIT